MTMHSAQYRVYYEDTDAGGVVYHSRYLNFAERARTDMLRNVGITQSSLIEEKDLMFVVKKLNMNMHAPAKLDDMLTIQTTIKSGRQISRIFIQNIYVDDKLIAEIEVVVACVNSGMKLQKIPDNIGV